MSAIRLAVLAAFLWSTYYVFVLGLGGNLSAASLIVYPFLFGGLAYFAWVVAGGELGDFWATWRQPAAYLRAVLLMGMQVSVLAATYAAGPIDSALLSLIGDVVVTPLLVMVIFAETRGMIRSSAFLTGITLCLAGGTLTLIGGQTVRAIHGAAWLVAAAVPLTVAFYFLLTAQENRRTSPSCVLAQATLAAAGGSVLISPFLPGGLPSLLAPTLPQVGILVGMGVVVFFLAPVAYFRGIEEAGLLLPAMLMAAIPAFTLALSVLFLGISPPYLAILGIPVAGVGAIFAMQGEHPPWSRETMTATAPLP